MEKLKAKLRKQGGFTMVELLIVVAIIAILVAVSIPMIGAALEKSRDAVDIANKRDAIALGNILYLTDEIKTETEKYYKVSDDSQGTLVDSPADATVGVCTGANSGKDTNCVSGGHTSQIIKVTIKPDGTVTATWVDKT